VSVDYSFALSGPNAVLIRTLRQSSTTLRSTRCRSTSRTSFEFRSRPPYPSRTRCRLLCSVLFLCLQKVSGPFPHVFPVKCCMIAYRPVRMIDFPFPHALLAASVFYEKDGHLRMSSATTRQTSRGARAPRVCLAVPLFFCPTSFIRLADGRTGYIEVFVTMIDGGGGPWKGPTAGIKGCSP
jgi:hypothetical protein